MNSNFCSRVHCFLFAAEAELPSPFSALVLAHGLSSLFCASDCLSLSPQFLQMPTPSNSAEPDNDVTVGHVPDAQANVLYRQFELGYIKMTCIITGHSRAVPEGVWVQGGGIEIPCLYDVEIQEEVSRDVRKCLKENLKSLRTNADGSA